MSCLTIALAVSMHLGLSGDYNQVHPHAQCKINNDIYGVFYNSESNLSVYAGKKINNFEVGLVTGYSGADVIPMIRYIKNSWFISPSYEWNKENIGITIGYEVKLK